MIKYILWLFIAIQFTFAQSKLSITKNGQPNAAIIIDKKPNVSSACAAMELQYHFKKMTGAIIPILNAPETKYPVNILVGESPHTKKLGYKNEDFKHQEYGLFFKKNNIIIIGKDIDKPYTDKLLTFVGEEEKAIPGPGIYDEQGTLYATYDFLEKYCGVRWYGPKEIQIIFPKTKNLTVTSKDIKRKPRFIWRVLSNPEIEGIAGWIVGTRMWDHPPKDLVQQYGRRLKSGGYSYYANHSLEAYYDRFSKKYKKYGKVVGEKNQYFERHEPNFFIKEKNDNIPSFSIDYHHQLNFLYKGVEDQVVKDAEGYFERGVVPVGSHGKGNYYSVIPNDNWHFDGLNDGTYVNEDYPEITAYKTDHGRIVPPWNEETASRINNEVGTGEWSDYWFTFINKVAGRIKKKYPDKYIATLAYGRYALYPQNVKVADNVSIQLCLRVRNWFDPFVKKRSLEILSDWCNRGEDRPIYLWLYYCWPSEELGAKFKFEPFPPFYPRIQAKQIKLYDRLKNIRGAFVNGTGEQLDTYIFFKLMDDPDMNIDTLLDEFFTLQYGKAAEALKQFYFLIEEIHYNKDNWPDFGDGNGVGAGDQNEEIAWGYLGNPLNMRKLGKFMNKAKKAKLNPIERKRVEIFDKAVWQHMLKGHNKYYGNK